MVEIDDTKFKAACDELRDLLNWLVIIEKEYELTKKDAKKSRKHLENVAKHLQKGLIHKKKPKSK